MRRPGDMIHPPIVGSILGQRRRLWTNIDPTMGQCVLAEYNLRWGGASSPC